MFQKIFFITITVISFWIFSLASSKFMILGITDSLQELQCELIVDKSEYELGEPIRIQNYLSNNTDQEITVCAWPTKEEIIFTRYKDGEKIIHKDQVSYEKPVSAKESFITIKPRSKTYYSTEELGADYFNEYGGWELQIIYEYAFTGKDFGISGWRGVLKSNILPFEIKKKNSRG